MAISRETTMVPPQHDMDTQPWTTVKTTTVKTTTVKTTTVDYDSEDDEDVQERVENSHIAGLEKQISEMQETEQRLRKQMDELDATAKRYRSERNAMRIGVVDALNRVQKKMQGKHREEDIITLNDVFATSLKIAHKDIEILQTYDNEGESATKVLIGLLKIYDRNCATSELIKLLLSRIEL